MAWALLLVVFFEHIKKHFSTITSRVPIFLNPLCQDLVVGLELGSELGPLPSPLMVVLRLVDSDVKPAMRFIYEEMDCGKEKIKSNFSNIKKR